MTYDESLGSLKLYQLVKRVIYSLSEELPLQV